MAFEYKMRRSCISWLHIEYSLYLIKNAVQLTEVGGKQKLKRILIVINRDIEIALEKDYITM